MITTIVIVFVLYLLLMLAISWMGRKHASTFDEYLTVGKKTPLLLLVGGAVGAQVGNGLVVGGAGSGAAVGLAGIGYGLGCTCSYLIIFVFSKRIRDGGYLTAAEYLSDKYKSNAVTQFLNLAYCISIFPGLGAQILAANLLFDALGLNGTYGVIALCVVVFLYSQISGLWGAMATSVAQTAIIALGVILAVIYIIANGGMSEITAAVASGDLPETFLNLKGYDLATWMFCMLPAALSAPIDSVSWQRIASADSEKSARNHFWIASLIMLPLCIAPVFIGMYGRAHFGVADNTAFFNVVLHTFPPVLAALVVVAVIAAVMSTIDGMLISQSVFVLKGLYKGTIGKNASDAQLQKLTLPVNILTILISAYFAFSSNSIVGLLSNGYLFIGAIALAPVICGWLWKGTTRKGAIAGMLSGAIIALLQLTGIYELPYSGITYLLPPFAVLIVISLLTKEKNIQED